MCGIFGIIAKDGKIPDGVLERGTASLAHRGPDDSGTIVLQDSAHGSVEIGLGSRRLAIVDLSPLGHQPMHDPENGNWIVYNGEIYNFREVRGELEKLGTIFASHTDTEVALKAFARWGARASTGFAGCLHSPSGVPGNIASSSRAIRWASSLSTMPRAGRILSSLQRFVPCWKQDSFDLIWITLD